MNLLVTILFAMFEGVPEKLLVVSKEQLVALSEFGIGVGALSESAVSVESVAVQQDEVFKKNDVLLGVLSKSVVETNITFFFI